MLFEHLHGIYWSTSSNSNDEDIYCRSLNVWPTVTLLPYVSVPCLRATYSAICTRHYITLCVCIVYACDQQYNMYTSLYYLMCLYRAYLLQCNMYTSLYYRYVFVLYLRATYSTICTRHSITDMCPNQRSFHLAECFIYLIKFICFKD